MQNIKIPQRTGNAIAKHAYLELIADSLTKLSVNRLEMGGYDNDADRVHFKYGGTRCTLYGVLCPDIHRVDRHDVLTLIVKARRPFFSSKPELYELPVDVRDFRFKTLDRIAYEVYDYCKREDDDEYEEARTEYIANGMDEYREFMS
jgi:hypothetical protein